MILPFLVTLFLQVGTASTASPQDDLPADTLREVTVRPDSLLPVELIINERMGRKPKIGIPSVSDVLDRLSPGLNDKILHPFAVKQRKRERRKARSLKALEEYDRVKTFDELLREAYEQQMLEDSLQRVKAK